MSTPVVRNERQSPSWTNFDPHIVETMVVHVQGLITRDDMTFRILDEALGEQFDDEERVGLGQDRLDAAQHWLLGRALLRVAEQEFIQAAGVVD